jgi:hypothetical protein
MPDFLMLPARSSWGAIFGLVQHAAHAAGELAAAVVHIIG